MAFPSNYFAPLLAGLSLFGNKNTPPIGGVSA
jgi:hypothetical protein